MILTLRVCPSRAEIFWCLQVLLASIIWQILAEITRLTILRSFLSEKPVLHDNIEWIEFRCHTLLALYGCAEHVVIKILFLVLISLPTDRPSVLLRLKVFPRWLIQVKPISEAVRSHISPLCSPTKTTSSVRWPLAVGSSLSMVAILGGRNAKARTVSLCGSLELFNTRSCRSAVDIQVQLLVHCAIIILVLFVSYVVTEFSLTEIHSD